MMLYIVLYVMMPVLTVIYGCYRVLFCFLHVNKDIVNGDRSSSRP